jgi:WD40 repeat protein
LESQQPIACLRFGRLHLFGTFRNFRFTPDALSTLCFEPVQIWQMKRAHCAPLVLNHPCFVYTVKFHPSNYYQVATGAWDGAVRIWCIQESLRSTIKEPVLLQCVAATGSVAAATFHGQVLALCWLRTPTSGPLQPSCPAANPLTSGSHCEYLLFSGCSRGHLMALKQDDGNQSWQPFLKLKLKEINNIAINELHPYPVGANRLLLFCRDGVQRMVDFHL